MILKDITNITNIMDNTVSTDTTILAVAAIMDITARQQSF
jgi:hypothetical protein